MAKIQAVWGIDIGNTSLKALRCSLAEEPGKIQVLACDFIEHSKVLTQPGTDATEVLAETLQTFLNRNETKGDRIAISVSGQNTISRFLPLPPVEPKKIPDVVRYEAKQWLPFDLGDVVFDFQPLGNPVLDDDFLLDATVGMFAIKRDVVSKTLAPYMSRSVDIDCIQSSPIALYNFVAFDQLSPFATEDPNVESQESLIALCIGTDATDVVITNGTSIWIRNIPLGGNSFTKALTRELQLTFSKAEYLKRNIASSKDMDEQKRVITAMRSVFSDMVNEVNRSLEYYQTLNRKAKFKGIVALGNAVKLPGLRQYLAQNLGYEVVRLNRFNHLIGTDVTETQLFKDNLPSFAVCYGLVVQQLGISSLKTNLIPREVIVERIIREKKPWALVASAALLLGITIQFVGASIAHNSVVTQAYKDAENKAKNVQSYASDMKSKTGQAVSAFNSVDEIGKKLTSNVEGRITWLELLRAVNAALPQSQPGANATIVKPTTSANFAEQDRVFIESVEAMSVDSLSAWFTPLKQDNRYYPDDEELHIPISDTSSSDGAAENSEEGQASKTKKQRSMTESERFALVTGPSDQGSAKIVQIVGYHYHNPADFNKAAEEGGEAYLRHTLLRNLKFCEVELPPTLEEQLSGIKSQKVKMSALGIMYPTLLYVSNIVEEKIINPDLPNPLPAGVVIDPDLSLDASGSGTSTPTSSARGNTRGGTPSQGPQQITLRQYARQRGILEPALTVRRFDFVIQFAWVETPPSQRKQNAEGTGIMSKK